MTENTVGVRSDLYPVGTLVKVALEIATPVAATPEQIEEWLEFSFHVNGSCSGKNPLLHHDPEPFRHDADIQFTGFVGRREEYGHEKQPNGSTTYRVRYVREAMSREAPTAPPQDSTA